MTVKEEMAAAAAAASARVKDEPVDEDGVHDEGGDDAEDEGTGSDLHD